MSDYLVIQETEKGLGRIEVSNSVVDSIVRNVLDEFSVVSLDEVRSMKAAPVLKMDNGTLTISLKVRVKYGSDVEKSCLELQKGLVEAFALMLDYQNPEININVVGFKFN